jgi:ribulose-phosphate 3-epimerase
MSVIVPAILTKSREDLDAKLAQLAGLSENVQVDVIDGRFSEEASWPYTEKDPKKIFLEGEMLPYVDQLTYEIDLMVSNPEEVTGAWLAAGATRLTIHVESTKYLQKAITELQTKYGHAKDFVPGLLSVGLAINITTDMAILDPFISSVDYIQFMGIATIGKQAQPFDDKVLRKITQFRQKHSDIAIQVDGGVSLKTAPALLSAGVDRLIVGSALWNAPDLAAEFHAFEELVHEYGVYS